MPAPTHARKLTENRTLALGDATTILRWYDYPLPNDPGSEDGGFPYAVTRKGSVVSVLAFREMGKGVAPAHFEALARTAAGSWLSQSFSATSVSTARVAVMQRVIGTAPADGGVHAPGRGRLG